MSIQRNQALYADIGIMWLRVLVGAGMMYHGYGKVFGGNIEQLAGGVEKMGFPMPIVFAWAAALSEFAGGLLLIIGLWTRAAAFFVFFTMTVAAFIMHGSDPFSAKELALAYWAASGALIGIGGGGFSLDHCLKSR